MYAQPFISIFESMQTFWNVIYKIIFFMFATHAHTCWTRTSWSVAIALLATHQRATSGLCSTRLVGESVGSAWIVVHIWALECFADGWGGVFKRK